MSINVEFKESLLSTIVDCWVYSVSKAKVLTKPSKKGCVNI